MVRALILAPFSHRHVQRLAERLDVTHESWMETRRLIDPEELATRILDDAIEILVIESDFVFEEVFEEAKSLKLVGVCRGTTSHVDVGSATEHGVLVVNTPGRNAQAVAEHALGLMLALARRIHTAHRYVAEGSWNNPAEPYISMRGIELAGRTLGIIGLGAIGSRLARLGCAIGMKIIAYDPYVKSAAKSVRLTDLDEVMGKSDFVSIHMPPVPKTEGMIDAQLIGRMKAQAFLINTTGTSVVDMSALTEALRAHRIGGAAFDVFETHPLAPDSPLLALDNVVLTPHIGGATDETIERHSEAMADDVLRFVDGKRPRNLVNPEAWERRG
ncbi:MAG: 3-phosphoglycerate dehydrogenase [Chloroflexi bacterium]|nr:3-phosphoglycerate dehydrogenase [Chloroflexota bacterium]